MNFYKIVIFLIFSLRSLSALAYIDPGAGSIMIQVFVGVFAGLLYFFKTKFHFIKSFFLRKKEKQKKDP